MDERAIKKLVITVVVAIAIIMLFKYMLTRSYSNLNKINSATNPHSAVLLNVTKLPDAPAASAVMSEPVTAEPVSSGPASVEPISHDPAAAGAVSPIPASDGAATPN